MFPSRFALNARAAVPRPRSRAPRKPFSASTKAMQVLFAVSLTATTFVTLPLPAQADEAPDLSAGVVVNQNVDENPFLEEKDTGSVADVDVLPPELDEAYPTGQAAEEDHPGVVSLEDLLGEGGEDDPLLRPSLGDSSSRTVGVGNWSAGWPQGNEHTANGVFGGGKLVVFVPTDAHKSVSWPQLVTRIGDMNDAISGNLGAYVTVPPFLQVLRSPTTAAARITNAFYSSAPNAVSASNVSAIPQYGWPLPTGVSGTGSPLLLSTAITSDDLRRAGVLELGGIGAGITVQHFGLSVIPSAANGALIATDKTAGRWWSIDFVQTHDPASPPPVVVTHPESIEVVEGGSAGFSGSATGATSQQWQVSSNDGATWQDMVGETDLGLSINSVSMDMDGRLFRLAFTNDSGTVETNPARLTVTSNVAAPVIVEHPNDVAVGSPREAIFSASAESDTEVSVRWQMAANRTALEQDIWEEVEGAVEDVLNIPATAAQMDGRFYRAVFSNGTGSVATNAAMLTVWESPGARVSLTPRAVRVSTLFG